LESAVYNFKPPVATPSEQAAEVARFHAEMIAEEARKSPEALLAYLREHFPARWVQCVPPTHRFWDAPCAEYAFGKVLVKVTFSKAGCAVDLYPNVMPQRRSVHAVEFAQELRAAVKVAAVSQSPAMDLPMWAI
jgi:hypothetical protein